MWFTPMAPPSLPPQNSPSPSFTNSSYAQTARQTHSPLLSPPLSYSHQICRVPYFEYLIRPEAQCAKRRRRQSHESDPFSPASTAALDLFSSSSSSTSFSSRFRHLYHKFTMPSHSPAPQKNVLPARSERQPAMEW